MKSFLILLTFTIFNSFAYTQLQQILILNEGAFDYVNNKILVPVTIGSFNPLNGSYTMKNEIEGARFSSDIVIDGGSYWVAADKMLVKYELKTHQKQHEYILEGIRKIAFYKDLVVVTRGEYLKNFLAYVQIYNKKTFELLFEIPFNDLPYTAESIIIKHGIAFVAINNGFDFGKEVGKIVKIDLDKLQIIETIDLGPNGKNPENLMIKDDLVMSLNNKDYTGSSISLIHSGSSNVSTYNLSNVSSLCGTSALVGESVIYQEIGKTDLGSFDILSRQSAFLKNLGKSFYGLSYDAKSKYICAAETDFRTTGKVYIYDINFNELFSFDAGVAPGYFAFDDASSVAVQEVNSLIFELSPNPIVSKFKVIANQVIDEVKVFDFYGRELIKKNNVSVNLEDIQAGPYILMVKSKDKIAYKRFVKARI